MLPTFDQIAYFMTTGGLNNHDVTKAPVRDERTEKFNAGLQRAAEQNAKAKADELAQLTKLGIKP